MNLIQALLEHIVLGDANGEDDHANGDDDHANGDDDHTNGDGDYRKFLYFLQGSSSFGHPTKAQVNREETNSEKITLLYFK